MLFTIEYGRSDDTATPDQEFVRSKDLSVGVYKLDPGMTDSQQPHREDEL